MFVRKELQWTETRVILQTIDQPNKEQAQLEMNK